jgi:hypothetical protein
MEDVAVATDDDPHPSSAAGSPADAFVLVDLHIPSISVCCCGFG